MNKDPLTVTCPKCGAGAGVPCKRAAEHEGQSHNSRVKAAQATGE